MRVANRVPNMFTFADKVIFSRAREMGMGFFVGFVMLGAGASLSPAASDIDVTSAASLAPDWSLAPAANSFFNSVTLPEPASPWFYSIAGGLCLLIVARRKAQL
jgi:hypothetical protein